MRRHGSPDQRGITKADLKPYLMIVRARIEKNEGLPIWGLLDQRWVGTVEVAAREQRTTYSKWTRRAAIELQKVGQAVAPRTVVETVLAVYLMMEMAGHRFRSDTACDTQLVRRVRGLTEVNASITINAKGKAVRSYTDLPPRATAAMADWLKASLGQAGVWLARQEKAKEEADRKAKDEFDRGLTEVDFG